jgi:hypothetical protein
LKSISWYIHAASATNDSNTFFGTIEKLFSVFSTSTHRWDILLSFTGTGLKRCIETRWSARADAVTTVKKNFKQILEALEELSSPEENLKTRTEALISIQLMESFKFICYQNFWEPVLAEINETQKYLQKKGLNIHHCDIKLNTLKTYLINEKAKIIENAITQTQKLCDELEIPMDCRLRGRKKNVDVEALHSPAQLISEQLRNNLELCMKSIIEEISTRFKQLHNLATKFSCIVPSNLLNKELEFDINILNDFHDINKEEFLTERKRLQAFMAVPELSDVASKWKADLEGPLEVLSFIQKYRLENSLPNLSILLRIFLTIAISIASCERSFSKLNLIKNYLRSTMSNLRLSNLGILSIEREETDSINFEEIIEEFASLKARKGNM